MNRKLHSILLSSLCVMMIHSLSSCINDSDGGCVQYAVSTRLVDKAGNALPDSVARMSSAYMFLNGKYSYSVPYGSDGCFHVSFNGCDDARLVVFADRNVSGFSTESPSRGTDIESSAVSLDSISQPDDSARQSRLYYGSLSFSDIVPDETDTARVVMADRLARVRIAVARELTEGESADYSVRISGICTGMRYDGKMTDSYTTCTPAMGMQQDGSLMSATMAMFPSGTPLKVEIYHGSRLLAETTTDSGGSALEAESGDNKVFVINIYSGTLGIRVMPWSEYIKQNVVLI